MSGSDTLRIERLGGLGGFGLPGSRVRSCGEIEYGSLDAVARQVVDQLFSNRSATPARGASAPVPDGFRYRLSRGHGTSFETVQVAEAELPEVILGSLRDEFV
jgi:emfourin